MGEDVILPCNVDQESCGEVYFITWTKYEKEDRWSRIYLYSDKVEKPLRDLAGRASFNVQKTQAKLTINQLTDDDSTLYKVNNE